MCPKVNRYEDMGTVRIRIADGLTVCLTYTALILLQLTYICTTTTASPRRSHWNIGPQQLSVAEVSIAFKFFI
jgi:hypothetical protein